MCIMCKGTDMHLYNCNSETYTELCHMDFIRNNYNLSRFTGKIFRTRSPLCNTLFNIKKYTKNTIDDGQSASVKVQGRVLTLGRTYRQ